MQIELGAKYRDVVTGFEGVATSHVRYLTGCDQVCLNPQLVKDGKPVEGLYFDVNRLERIGTKKISLPGDEELSIGKGRKGGPQRDAPGSQA